MPNHKPHRDYYTPDEDLVLEEVMELVLVRYGGNKRWLRRVLERLYEAAPDEFERLLANKLVRG